MTEPYSVLAGYYDRLMEDTDYGAWCDFYRACFAKYGVSVTRILDLACGTGNLTIPLAAAGYEMTGIDLSSEMLALARKKADDAGLQICLSEQNIAGFDAGGTYDAAVCGFDGINYLTDAADVRACFAHVARALADGGLFLFDVNTPYKYENVFADNAYVYEYDDLFVTWQNGFRRRTGLCDFYLTFFVKRGNGWHRFDEVQRQRRYPIARLAGFLKDAGLTVLETVGGTDFSPLTATSERCFFICRKG